MQGPIFILGAVRRVRRLPLSGRTSFDGIRQSAILLSQAGPQDGDDPRELARGTELLYPTEMWIFQHSSVV